jgi:hypothetical protein
MSPSIPKPGLTLLIADATPALQHLSIIGKKHPTQSAFNSPSIGTEVFNSLLANREHYISQSDWAVGCFANPGKTAAKVPEQWLW